MWHWILGRLEDILVEKHIPMTPIEMVGMCNFDDMVVIGHKIQNVFLAGPRLRHMVMFDRKLVKEYHDGGIFKLEFFIVGKEPQTTLQQLIDDATWVNPHGFYKETPVIVTRISLTQVQLRFDGEYDIMVYVTDSPTIQEFVIKSFGKMDRVWAAVTDLVVWALPSTEYALKSILPYSNPREQPSFFRQSQVRLE